MTKKDIFDQLRSCFTGEQASVISDIFEQIQQEFKEQLEQNNPDNIEVSIRWDKIRNTCGWDTFCRHAGGNSYMINEWGESNDSDRFETTLAIASKLGLL